LNFFSSILASRKKSVRDRLSLKKIPVHVAVIMDGNGRWAAKRNLPRSLGHKAGIEPLRENKISDSIFTIKRELGKTGK